MADMVGGVSYAPDVKNAEATAPRQVYNFWNGSGAAIADGDCVVIDVSVTTHGQGTAIEVSTTDDDAAVVGIADEAIANLSWGKVVTYGVKLDAKCNGSAVSQGGLVQKSNTSGAVEAAADAATTLGGNIGFALSASTDSDTKVDLFVKLN